MEFQVTAKMGKMLAVVEARRTTQHARLLEAQLTHYGNRKGPVFWHIWIPGKQVVVDGYMKQYKGNFTGDGNGK